MKKASIIGLGSICEGDLGVGSYIVEALSQEPLGNAIDLAYLADDPRDADMWLYEMDFAAIVGALSMGGPAGRIYCWDHRIFQQNVPWLACESRSIRVLVKALAMTEFAGGFPGELLFLWIEPQVTAGLGISKEVRKALRTTVQIIKKNLFERGFLPETMLKVSPIYRLELLGTVA